MFSVEVIIKQKDNFFKITIYKFLFLLLIFFFIYK